MTGAHAGALDCLVGTAPAMNSRRLMGRAMCRTIR